MSQSRIDKKRDKELQLNTAIDDMEKAAALVKVMTAEVKSGVIPQSDLLNAIKSLQAKGQKVKIYNAQAKVFGEWTAVTLGEDALPAPKTNNSLWIFISIIALVYLVTK